MRRLALPTSLLWARAVLALATPAAAFTATTAHAQDAARTGVASYTTDPTHTFVHFEVLHFNTSTTRGRFDRVSGSVTLDRTANHGSARISIDMASINTGIAPFNTTLRGGDFFAVEQHPTATFVATRFPLVAGGVGDVPGELTLRGVTRPLTLKALRFNCYDNPLFRREVCGGDFEATVSRSAFGITWGGPFIPDTVKLVIQIEGIREQ